MSEGTAGFVPPRRKDVGTEGQAPRDKAEVASKMRQLLASKKSAKTAAAAEAAAPPGAPADGGASAASSGPRLPPEEKPEEADPWPEVMLPSTLFGIEDGKSRAIELQRRGDFQGAVRMWRKVLFVARLSASMPATEAFQLLLGGAEAFLLLEDWGALARVSTAALEAARSADNFVAPLVQLLCGRARARVELGCVEAARADMSEAVSKELDSMDGDMENVQAASRQLETRIAELKRLSELEARRVAVAAAPVSSTLSNSAPSQPARPALGKGGAKKGVEDNASTFNQEFFGNMEKDYVEMCESDGWEDIRRVQEELKRAPLPLAKEEDLIPAESDYFRVRIPHGANDREVRASQMSEANAAAYRLEPPKPRRNLDELRRVEAATKEAIEKEKAARLAASAADREKHPPIKCKSDVVRIDDLDAEAAETEKDSESEDGEPLVRGNLNSLDDLEGKEADVPNEDQANAAIAALKEFERLGKEKDEKLARWRERFGS